MTIDFAQAILGTQVRNELALGDFYTELLAGDVSHNSATDRQLFAMLRSPSGFNTFIAKWGGFASAQVTGRVSGFEPMFAAASHYETAALTAEHAIQIPRPLIVPPGWALQFVADSAAVAWVITVSLVGIIHPLAEPGALL